MKTLHEEASSICFPVSPSKNRTSSNPAAFARFTDSKTYSKPEKKTIQSMKYFNSVYHCDFINSIKIKPVANYAYRSIVGNAFDTSSSTRGSSMKFGLDRQVKGVDPTLQYHYISCLTHNCLDRTGSIFLKNIRRNTRN